MLTSFTYLFSRHLQNGVVINTKATLIINIKPTMEILKVKVTSSKTFIVLKETLVLIVFDWEL